MKIDINRAPPADIFKNHGRMKIAFILLLGLACLGVLAGVYAIFSATKHYALLEKTAIALFIGSALPLFLVGEKLQALKALSPEQKKELAALGRQFFEIQGYCDLVAQSNRRIIFAEYEACRDWAEEKRSIADQDKQ